MSGCLTQRHGDALARELPEVDVMLGTSTFHQVAERVVASLQSQASAEKRAAAVAQIVDIRSPEALPLEAYEFTCGAGRYLGDHGGSAYLKIAEGCDRRCAFCIIPELRGGQRSRPIASIVAEARALVESGVWEINLIAQDLTAYGHELDDKPSLPALLRALEEIEGLRWIRCLYAYPQGVGRAMREVLATSTKVLPYLDVPVQHVSNSVLRRMRRGSGGAALRRNLARLRAEVPNLVLRSTLLVGFPGESEDDFKELETFVEQTRFDRLGVFSYCDEEEAPSFQMRSKVPKPLADKRQRALMRRQRRISKKQLASLRGSVHEAIVEGFHAESDLLVVGRLWSQAPEIDGMCYISSSQSLSRGQIVKVRVVESHDYDVVAELVDDDTIVASPFGRARIAHTGARS